MLALTFGDPAAMARVRFGISPLIELMRSVRALDGSAVEPLHHTWVADARVRTAGLDLDLPRALQPAGAYAPDFVNPPPSSPVARLEDELERMIATPPAQVTAELERAYRGRAVPEVLGPLLAEPRRVLVELAELLSAYWDRALAPHWSRLRSLLQSDVRHRARHIADGGVDRLFAEIDPAVAWSDGTLRIGKACCAIDMTLTDRGLLLVPSAFVWPDVEVVADAGWQPTIIYRARGLGTLWEPPPAPAATGSLTALLGRRGAALAALDEPLTTTELARRLAISPGGASQHLAALRNAGLAQRDRVGRVVLYVRSEAGETLVRAAAGEQDVSRGLRLGLD